MPSSRVCRLPLEVGGNEVDDLPHTVPSGGLHLRYGAIDHERQRDGRVVAPEAGQDVLRHHPDQLTALGFELASKDRFQTPEPIRSRVQHWKLAAPPLGLDSFQVAPELSLLRSPSR